MRKYIFKLTTNKPPENIENYSGGGEEMEPAEWWDTDGVDYDLLNEMLEWDDENNLFFKGEIESNNVEYDDITRILGQFAEEFNIEWTGEFYMIDEDGKFILEAPYFDLEESE